MIVVLDPIFLAPPHTPFSSEELDAIAMVNSMCRRRQWRLPRLQEYWNTMWGEFGRAFEKASNPDARQALRALRDNADEDDNILPLESTTVWSRGFREMFSPLGEAWAERMMRAISRAVSADADVILLTRKVVGRNVKRHAASDTLLDEITRWMLYVQPKRVGPRAIPCVHHRRNISLKWSVRYDWRLPATEDGAKYPFCPADNWWYSSVSTQRTIEGKPAWVDRRENGWARPNIPGGAGYHWDVFIRNTADEEAVGLKQINVVEYGSREGVVGSLHHVPGAKRSRVKDVGWTCD